MMVVFPAELFVFDKTKVPELTVTVPPNVFAPERVHVPVPDFAIDVLPEPSPITPLISPVPDVDPCNVKVLLALPVAVKLELNFKFPVPD